MSYLDDVKAAYDAEVAAGRLTGGETDQEVLDHFNAVTTSRERDVIPAHEVIDATVPSEWAALSDAEKNRFQVLTGVGEINVQSANVRAAFLAMFSPGTTTRSNLVALQTETVTWGQFYGVGTVRLGDIEFMRTL